MVTVFGQLRWSAILLATVAYYVLGAIWFTPVFGRVYDKALGFERAKGYKWPLIYYIGPFISSLFVTVAISVLIYAPRCRRAIGRRSPRPDRRRRLRRFHLLQQCDQSQDAYPAALRRGNRGVSRDRHTCRRGRYLRPEIGGGACRWGLPSIRRTTPEG